MAPLHSTITYSRQNFNTTPQNKTSLERFTSSPIGFRAFPTYRTIWRIFRSHKNESTVRRPYTKFCGFTPACHTHTHKVLRISRRLPHTHKVLRISRRLPHTRRFADSRRLPHTHKVKQISRRLPHTRRFADFYLPSHPMPSLVFNLPAPT